MATTLVLPDPFFRTGILLLGLVALAAPGATQAPLDKSSDNLTSTQYKDHYWYAFNTITYDKPQK